MVLLRTHCYRHELVGGCTFGGFAASEQVGPRAADGVLEGVGQEGCQEEGNEQAEDSHVGFVEAVRGLRGGEQGGDEGEDDEREEGRVEDVVS